MSYPNKSLIEQTMTTGNSNKSFIDYQDGINMKKGTDGKVELIKDSDKQTMTEKINQRNLLEN